MFIQCVMWFELNLKKVKNHKITVFQQLSAASNSLQQHFNNNVIFEAAFDSFQQALNSH